MVLKGIVRLLVVIGLFAGSVVALAPTAAAHDNDCTLAVHVGPVKEHIMCDDRKKDKSDCMASTKVLFVHERLFCE